jgi:uncharacterized protein DUF5658
MRFARLPQTAALSVVLATFSTAAAAQEHNGPTGDVSAGLQSIVSVRAAPLPMPVEAPERRPAALVPLYASFITLQILDLHSTYAALSRGGVEANPMLSGLTGNMVAISAVKAAGTAGVIFVSEKLHTKNKAAAVGLMIAANSAMFWVVQHNYRLDAR